MVYSIIFLEELSKKLEKTINELENIYKKLSENKESLKITIQKIFISIRNTLNDRENKLLLDVEKQFDNLDFKEELIKESEKIHNRAEILIGKGKRAVNEMEDKSKINSIINDCINIEKNIKDIKLVNEKIKMSNLLSNKEVKFRLNEDINLFLEKIKQFGIVYNI